MGKDRLTISEAHLSPKDLEVLPVQTIRIARPVEIKIMSLSLNYSMVVLKMNCWLH